jgi:curved DNA-binding protein CbpA
MKKSLYDLVGVPPIAPREMIASACRRRIAKLEGTPGDEAKAEIYAVREAWSILGDDKLRAGYDASLAVGKPGADGAGKSASLASEIDSASVSHVLFKPRSLLPEYWERYRKLVFAMVFVGLFALSAAWNQSRQVAAQKRIEAATYEAEYGEAKPAKNSAKAESAKPAAAEPFSAEKYEKELREREAEIQAQVEKDQTAKEDEFRNKLQQDNGTYSPGRRRYR